MKNGNWKTFPFKYLQIMNSGRVSAQRNHLKVNDILYVPAEKHCAVIIFFTHCSICPSLLRLQDMSVTKYLHS